VGAQTGGRKSQKLHALHGALHKNEISIMLQTTYTFTSSHHCFSLYHMFFYVQKGKQDNEMESYQQA
jgi:hypothetical protein